MDSPKYPRTFHLPFSPGATNDDKRLTSVQDLIGKPLVVTEKADGSNVCMESKECFARSHSKGARHESFDAFKAAHAGIKHLIPSGTQFFGEWLYAKHSLPYTGLPGYFLLFGVRDLATSTWASWSTVEYWAKQLAVPTVPVLDKGIFLAREIEALGKRVQEPSLLGAPEKEGFVVRWASSFHDQDFSRAVAKFVRKGHVQTADHWTTQTIVRNGLKSV